MNTNAVVALFLFVVLAVMLLSVAAMLMWRRQEATFEQVQVAVLTQPMLDDLKAWLDHWPGGFAAGGGENVAAWTDMDALYQAIDAFGAELRKRAGSAA